MDVLALLMNIDKLIHRLSRLFPTYSFGSLMNIDKLIQRCGIIVNCGCFDSLMNIDKLIQIISNVISNRGFGSLMNIKLKETACGILFCKLLFYIQRGDRGTAFFGII